MNSPSVLNISRILLILILAAGLAATPNLMRAQDYTEEEYKEYQGVQAETDSAKKMDMIMTFLKSRPKSTLRKYVTAEYQKIVVGLQDQKNWKQIIALGDRFLSVVPNDNFTIAALATAYSATGNAKGFVAFGEKAYATKPSGELAVRIARAYLGLDNEAKFLQWGERAAAADSGNVEILYELTRRYSARQQTNKAVKYARMCLKALPNAKKPAGVSEENWKNIINAAYTTAYHAVGFAAYQNQDYSGAVKNFSDSIKYYKKNDVAYYYMGISYWQMNKLEPAMLNLAKAYVLKGSAAGEAKKYLEQLWRNSHRNSLTGIERVIQRAQQDLK
jgi:tetratricopeptide (TPR) repeat protein